MIKKLCYFSCLIFMLAFASTSMADLAAYYSMDEGSGNLVVDDSGNGHDGTIIGTETWVDGASDSSSAVQFGTAGSDGIECDVWDTTGGTDLVSVALWVKFTVNDDADEYQGIIANRNGNDDQYWGLEINRGDGSFYFGAAGDGGETQYGLGTVTADEWVHLAFTFDGETVVSYINGVEDNSSTTPRYGGNKESLLRIGSSDAGANTFEGAIDEVYVFSGEILTADDIASVMNGEMKPSSNAAALAKKPNPANNSEEVSIKVGGVSWVPGDYANTHNVFFGTDEAAVTGATLADAMGTDVYEALDVNSIAMDTFAYGTTYYWRVDEVNAPSDPGEYTGKTWNFTTELEGYPIVPADINNVIASSSSDNVDPNNTCTELGLDANDMHSTTPDTMWLSDSDSAIGAVAGDQYIQYEFEKDYKLFEMLVWNYNGGSPTNMFGAENITVEYSLDGENWTDLAGTITLNQAPGTADYVADSTVSFNGVAARFVKIRFYSNFSWGLADYYGLSEVRFTAIPTYAVELDPETEAEDIAVDAALSWTEGRDVDNNYLYISTDSNSITDGLVDPIIVDEATYSPALALGTTYFWRVDEVNDNEAYTTWVGEISSFATLDSIVIDDIEDYNDTDGYTVWNIWKSGFDSTDDNGGSFMGHEDLPYAEEATVHGGDQSAPMYYDNTGAYDFSQVVAQSVDLPIGKTDWSAGSPKTLTIYFAGKQENTVGDEELYCSLDGQEFVFEGDIAYLARVKWSQFDIDLTGVDLTDIEEIAIGIRKVGATGGSGVIYIDDIMLTGIAAESASDTIWIEAEDADTIGPELVILTEWNGTQGLVNAISGTGFITSDPNVTTEAADEPNSLGIATYTFTVSGGDYMINGRETATYSGGWQDSFWVRVTGDDVTTDVALEDNGWANWNSIPNGFVWGTGYTFTWDIVHNVIDDEPQDITWTLPAGTYTLEIAYRELGARLDAIEIIKVGE
jgi:hypothetical protein